MSFNFFKQFKLKTPAELVRVTRDALLALDSKTVAEVRLLEKVGAPDTHTRTEERRRESLNWELRS